MHPQPPPPAPPASPGTQVKFNVNKVDNMIIQAIALLDTLDKDINTFVMRVREW
jgi:RNA processing factor Prp31